MARWSGTAWVAKGTSPAVDPAALHAKPSLVLDANGTPIVGWEEQVGNGTSRVYVKRFNE